MNKFVIDQKLEIYGLPAISGMLNGEIVVVKYLPGHSLIVPEAYGVLRTNGEIVSAIERYLRPYPPDKDRGDMDSPSTWEDFEKATGISREIVQHGPPSGATT